MRVAKFTTQKDGTVKVEVDGCTSEECTDLTRPFEEALGTVDSTDLKPEYYAELDEIENYVEEN